MIYVYIAVGLTAFCVFQIVSRSAIMDSNIYHLLKVFAWVSIPIWPLTGIIAIIGVFVFGIIFLIQYLDEIIDRVIRNESIGEKKRKYL